MFPVHAVKHSRNENTGAQQAGSVNINSILLCLPRANLKGKDMKTYVVLYRIMLAGVGNKVTRIPTSSHGLDGVLAAFVTTSFEM